MLCGGRKGMQFFLSSTANVSIPVFQSFFTSCHSWWLSEFQKILTKVTSPLGSCAAMRWGSNPHARTTILRQSIFVDCRIFFCFSEHLSTPRNPSHHERVTSAVSLASTNSAVLSLSGWLPPMLALRGKGLQRWLALRCTLDYGANAKRR